MKIRLLLLRRMQSFSETRIDPAVYYYVSLSFLDACDDHAGFHLDAGWIVRRMQIHSFSLELIPMGYISSSSSNRSGSAGYNWNEVELETTEKEVQLFKT